MPTKMSVEGQQRRSKPTQALFRSTPRSRHADRQRCASVRGPEPGGMRPCFVASMLSRIVEPREAAFSEDQHKGDLNLLKVRGRKQIACGSNQFTRPSKLTGEQRGSGLAPSNLCKASWMSARMPLIFNAKRGKASLSQHDGRLPDSVRGRPGI